MLRCLRWRSMLMRWASACRAPNRQRHDWTFNLIPHRKGRVLHVSSPDRSAAVYLRGPISHGDHDRRCDPSRLTIRQALAIGATANTMFVVGATAIALASTLTRHWIKFGWTRTRSCGMGMLPSGHSEIADLDHAAGQQAIAGREALPAGFALCSLEFECRRSRSSECLAISCH
jgi:hypothetical protein